MPLMLSALPKRVEVRVNRGAVQRFRATIRKLSDRSPDDITGDSFEWRVSDAPAGVHKFSVVGVPDADPTTGRVVFVLSAANTSADAVDTNTMTEWFYTVFRTHASETFPVFQGKFKIYPVAR